MEAPRGNLRAVALIAGDNNVRGCLQFVQDISGLSASTFLISEDLFDISLIELWSVVFVCFCLQELLMSPGRSQDSLLASMDFIFTLLVIPQMAASLLVCLLSILVLLSLNYFQMDCFFLVACATYKS